MHKVGRTEKRLPEKNPQMIKSIVFREANKHEHGTFPQKGPRPPQSYVYGPRKVSLTSPPEVNCVLTWCIIHLDFDLDKTSSETGGRVGSSEAGHICGKKVPICSVTIVITAPPTKSNIRLPDLCKQKQLSLGTIEPKGQTGALQL